MRAREQHEVGTKWLKTVFMNKKGNAIVPCVDKAFFLLMLSLGGKSASGATLFGRDAVYAGP